MQRARAWHALTAVVAITALVLQTVLVLHGGRVLDETGAAPAIRVRLGRLVSYVTAFFLLLFWVASLVDRRARPVP